MNTNQLIRQLSEGLAPTPTVWPFWTVLAIWLVASVAYPRANRGAAFDHLGEPTRFAGFKLMLIYGWIPICYKLKLRMI